MCGSLTAKAAFVILRAFVVRWYKYVLQLHMRLEAELDYGFYHVSDVTGSELNCSCVQQRKNFSSKYSSLCSRVDFPSVDGRLSGGAWMAP